MAEQERRGGGRTGGAAKNVDPVAGKSVAEVFGEIVWLMSQDVSARELTLKELEWLVMPPILLKQFHITYAPAPAGRTVQGEAVRTTGAAGDKKPRFAAGGGGAFCDVLGRGGGSVRRRRAGQPCADHAGLAKRPAQAGGAEGGSEG